MFIERLKGLFSHNDRNDWWNTQTDELNSFLTIPGPLVDALVEIGY